MQDYTVLKQYKKRKTKKVLSMVISQEPVSLGRILVQQKLFDEDGDPLPELKVILNTSLPELQAEMARLQGLRKIINDFMVEEGL